MGKMTNLALIEVPITHNRLLVNDSQMAHYDNPKNRFIERNLHYLPGWNDKALGFALFYRTQNSKAHTY